MCGMPHSSRITSTVEERAGSLTVSTCGMAVSGDWEQAARKGMRRSRTRVKLRIRNSYHAERKGAFARFFAGAVYVTRGFSFARQHPSLWPWVLAPATLTLMAAIGGGAAAWRWGNAFVAAHTAN